MKCHQCDRPAIYELQDSKILLCLHCYSILANQQNIDFLKNAMMMNQALDEMDMVTGIPTLVGRVPVASLAKAMQRGHTLNNIVVNNSQIGILNTGNIEKIDAAITLARGTDVENIAHHMTILTQGVVSSKELNDAQKSELLELMEALAEQIVGQRKKATINAFLKAITEKLSGVLVLSKAANDLWTVIRTFFGI